MLSRRRLIRGVGAGLVGLPLLESLSARAYADTGFPTRVIFVSSGQGTLTDRLVIPGAGRCVFIPM